MGLRQGAAKILASLTAPAAAVNAHMNQQRTLQWLLKQGERTAYGRDHALSAGMGAHAFADASPLADYEAFRGYVQRIADGESNVLWPGLPRYFAKTSGTTSGTKYIPLSQHGLQCQIAAARTALLSHIKHTGNAAFTEGKMLFLQGSPQLDRHGAVRSGRLSGIVAHHVPRYLQQNRLPTMATNLMDDWEQKVSAIADEAIKTDLRLISGIPPWVAMFFEKVLEKTGANTVLDVFPNLGLFVHGGVNFEPYKNTIDRLIGGQIPTIETYPASEGFIAFDDSTGAPGMLLNLNAGIFYEFVPLTEVHKPQPMRLTLNEVECGPQYAIVLTTSSGLWSYLIGDTVRFVSLMPPRVVVSGRVKHFISAFGEHVIGEEVDAALKETSDAFGIEVLEFHVAPQVNPTEGLPYHEWFIECEMPLSAEFAQALDQSMRRRNSYYNDLVAGAVLRPLVITQKAPGSFQLYMKNQGKLGGQNKLPRLSNDRSVAEKLG